MSRLIEEEFDELVLYVAGLKKSLSRKQDDHLFIIQQQNQRLDDQARLIDELAWQIRDLRASVRSVNEKLKVVERQRNGDHQSGGGGTLPRRQMCKCDGYANVVVGSEATNGGRGGGGGGGGGGSSGVSLRRTQSLTKPRITIINEEISDGVEILHVEEYPDDYEEEEEQQPQHKGEYDESTYSRHSVRNSYDDGEGLYEPIQFVERRDYTAPTLSSAPLNTTSLSARHRQTKQQQPPTERTTSVAAGGRPKRSDQLFHFPPPPPIDYVVALEPTPPDQHQQQQQSFQLRPTRDYPLVQLTRRIRNGGGGAAGSSSSSSTAAVSSLAIVTEETVPEEQQQQRTEDFMRTAKSAAEREANSIKRRAYVLPSNRSVLKTGDEKR